MIDTNIYTQNYIQSLTEDIKADRNLVERCLFAFGLLEALSRVKMPFIFKGGTCLLLLLDNPKRLSTDIDIKQNKFFHLSTWRRISEEAETTLRKDIIVSTMTHLSSQQILISF